MKTQTLKDYQSANPTARFSLGVDLGTNMGLAMRHIDGRFNFTTIRFEKGGHPGSQYKRFRGWLTQVQTKHGAFDHVFYERLDFTTFTEAARTNFGFEATLLGWCALYNIEIIGVANNTVKKSIAGHGRASKDQMIEAVRNLGHDVYDDNSADALAVLRWGLKHKGLI